MVPQMIVMPEGLTNAPAAFQRFMMTSLRIRSTSLSSYIWMTFSSILTTFPNTKLTLRKYFIGSALMDCCLSRQMRVPHHFLRIHAVSQRLTMAPCKVQIIPRLAGTPESQRHPVFLRFANFYHHFIFGYSEITILLTCLTHKGTPWHFTNECHSAFEALKRLSPQLRSLPIGFQTLQITVETDASDYALTAVLSITTSNGKLHPIAFHSWTFFHSGTQL